MKTLVTSASRKLPLLRAIAAELGDDVVAGDRDPRCLAAYAWPAFWQMPDLDESSVDDVVDAVLARGFTHVIPTRDADVALLATRRAEFAARGVGLLASPPAAVALCQDKVAFADALTAASLPAIQTQSVDDLASVSHGRFVVKERYGAGSRGTALDVDVDAARAAAETLQAPVVQPFVSGTELSVDAYRARDGRVLGLIARSRDVVVNGESQVTTTVDPAPYSSVVTDALDVLGVEGHAVIQLIDNADGLRIVECNPRLGGASTLALAAGLRSLAWFAAEVRGDDPGSIPFAPKPVPLQLVRTAEDAIGAPRL